MLTPPSRGSRGFGTTRARVFGMALHTFAGSRCTHGGGADMLCHVAGSSGFRPPSHLGCGRCQPAHARLRGAGVAALPCRSGRRALATPHRCAAVLSDAVMADALACCPGRTAPYACCPGLSTAVEAALLCLWKRGMHAVRLNACMCGFDPMSSLVGREIARDRTRSREMRVLVDSKTSSVIHSTQVTYRNAWKCSKDRLEGATRIPCSTQNPHPLYGSFE